MANVWITAINLIIKAANLVPGVNIGEIGKIDLPRMGDKADKSSNDRGMGGYIAPALSSNDRGMGGLAGATSYFTVNVQGADPNAVVRALQDYNRTAGPIPVNTRAN